MTDQLSKQSRLGGVADRLSWTAAQLAKVGVVAMTVLLTYEVIARYFLRAPTHWTSDVATTTMIWLTFLAMGYCLREGHMIRITAVIGQLPAGGRKAAEALSLVAILLFSIFVIWIASRAMMNGIAFGRRQPSMLRMPTWIAELPIVLGFIILALQALADLLRLPGRPAPVFVGAGEQELPTDHPEVER
ncbi:MAG: TRAP transporter small permease [Paracoccus sp. (in: a-proteobacteria)]|uniref:TRAP transporter small permease n=1 Tax=Paracoccus sp. TaxID=267 RepID=UPI0026E111A4|nr:TRAP transporter small permease [Paracoccus sp. (in: a-proteobacteria)]MDO5632373.1 TRAP transporter small permease [Paracoccus sp. (in: a-proteobacteria)]